MPGEGPYARDHRARYGFGGASAALGRTLPLEDGERVIVQGALRFYRGPTSGRIGYVRLSNHRLLLLGHYALRPDHVIEVPPGALRALERAGMRLELTLARRDGGISFVSLAPWSGVTPVRGALKSLDQLTSDLRAWLGQGG
jgi:hypothetical protein